MQKIGLIIIALAMVAMVSTAAWSHPVYGPSGEITGETLETHEYGFSVPHRSDEIDPNGRVEVSLERLIISGYDLTEILTEALEYIPDGDVPDYKARVQYWLGNPTPISLAEEKIDEAQAELDRLKAQTELHKKIKAMIKILKGE